MTSHERDNYGPLVLKPSTSIARADGGERIVSRMVNETLQVVRQNPERLTPKRFQIGDFELCEPDYLQVLRWATALQWSPDAVLDTLANLSYPDDEGLDIRLRIENGSIQDLVWDGRRMPLEAFEWQAGIGVRRLAILDRMPLWPVEETLESLQCLHVRDLNLAELDLSPVPGLEWLYCEDNHLTELDLSSVPNLALLHCYRNQLTALDLSPVPRLARLECLGNELTDLDLSSAQHLGWLACGGNQLSDLNLPHGSELQNLACGYNLLTELDLSPVPNLKTLDCRGNQLAELDLSPVPNLKTLDCRGNQLAELDLSPVRALKWLFCQNNQISQLDLRPLDDPTIKPRCDENVQVAR